MLYMYMYLLYLKVRATDFRIKTYCTKRLCVKQRSSIGRSQLVTSSEHSDNVDNERSVSIRGVSTSEHSLSDNVS